MSYLINQTTDERDNTVAVITVYLDNGDQVVAQDSHPNYKAIVMAAIDGDLDAVRDLYNVPGMIQRQFNRLTERITVRGESLFVDGDPMDDGLAGQILRFLDEGLDFNPLAKFLDKLMVNSNEHSRKMTYDYLRAHKFTLTPDGDIIGYKGVRGDGRFSIHSGEAIVNGEVIRGRIPYLDGSIVEMPRSKVAHNPRESCSTGLHVSTFDYAGSFGDRILEVHVNPRDIVSVPTDAGGEKVRVCRLKVVGVIKEPYGIPLKADEPKKVYESPKAAPAPAAKAEPTTTGVKHPTNKEFETMIGRAKRRRRNFVKYAIKQGPWTFNGGDPKTRTNWVKA